MEKNYLITITNNLYQLTLLFPKKEPLRYKMRELADDVLAGFLRIKKHSNPSFKATEGTSQVLEDLEILDTYFAIAKDQKWVSPQNLLSVWEEYSTIRGNLEKLNHKEESFYASLPVRQEEKEEAFAEKKKQLNERQEKILEILKEKEKSQVGEFKEIFPEVTKRTLRRDFRQLLKDGKIERTGERNDTYYRLGGRT